RTGGRIAADQLIPLEAAASYEAEANEIASQDPECLAIISYEKAAAQFIRDFKKTDKFKSDPDFFIIGTDGVYTQGFLDLSLTDPGDPTSSSTAEGVFGTNPDTQP